MIDEKNNVKFAQVKVDSDAMMTALCELLKIRSVKEAPTENAPFGLGVKKALRYTLGLAESLGFETKNYDDHVGEVIWGSGKPFGVLCHLDVVPEGDLQEWNTDPYVPTVIDGKLYARGALDDKSGAISTLYAMKALLDAGYAPKRQIRLILGCDEESGWGCIDHYKTVATLPEEGISPDADFPVIYAEKGIVHIEYEFTKSPDLIWINGGERANVVCDKVEAKLAKVPLYADYPDILVDGDVVKTLGVAAHGSTPEKGINAMAPMIKFLEENGLVEKGVYEKVFLDSFKVKTFNDETGYLTFSPDVIRSDENKIYITVDVRYPSTLANDFIMENLGKIGKYTVKSYQAPLYSDKNGGLVKTLCDIYDEVTGEKHEPIAIGGGTYARALKNGVAFGPAMGEEGDSIHKPNEYVTLKTISLMNEIYLETLKRICF